MLRVRKTNLTTFECVRRLSDALGVSLRDIGYAGMKDRHAVTTQWLTVPYSVERPVQDVHGLELQGIEIVEGARHGHKMRTGHLRGNRFSVVLRKLELTAKAQIAQELSRLEKEGIPNAYGPQRFGRDGQNPARAMAWLQGRERGPQQPRERRLLFSSLQSLWFDEVLRRRVDQGTWNTVLAGDLVQKHASGGLFECEDEAVDAQRAVLGEVSATGPIYGAKMRWPGGRPAELEHEVLSEMLGDAKQLDRFRNLGEGSRRVLRIFMDGLRVCEVDGAVDALRVDFGLPKGAYATTILSSVCTLIDESQGLHAASNPMDRPGDTTVNVEDEGLE